MWASTFMWVDQSSMLRKVKYWDRWPKLFGHVIKLFDHLIFHIVNVDFPVVKYSEILLHGFRMANFGHEMADGQLPCYRLWMYTYMCVYWPTGMCVCATAMAIALLQCVYHTISIFAAVAMYVHVSGHLQFSVYLSLASSIKVYTQCL